MNDYERGRRDVRRELTNAFDKFSEDDSLGMCQLVDVVQPFLLEDTEDCDHKFIDSKHCLKCGWKP